MISIDEAFRFVRSYAQRKSPVRLAAADALGLTLADTVKSDIDSPPYHKSMVDGYAVVARDSAVGSVLEVREAIAAGAMPTKTVHSGTASQIMTGAPIPPGSDAVVMLEHVSSLGGDAGTPDRVRILRQPAEGENILRRGTLLRSNEPVLSAGKRIRPIEIGLLSEVGCTAPWVIPAPRVAVIATGDELVPPEAVPGLGQIRNSNGPMLAALVQQSGAVATILGIARDDHGDLRRMIQKGLLDYDVVLLSGGVSAGKLDLVPSVLSELEVKEVFHKVRLKPGKPLWFGVRSAPDPTSLVFGLPGNPVSTLVCFHLFVRSALMLMGDCEPLESPTRRVRLAVAYRQQGERPTMYPSRLEVGQNGTQVRPLDWRGSADLRTLTDADCLAFFPEGDRQYQPGDWIDVYEL
jgi:molybdopterin molybdotransferase